ncbi:MAG: hypothetical protein KDM63_03570 [Verrucomicrobiae bacterium]|nr:hypothetical protein [Verrucomicrobiae bacterium]
MAIIQDWKFRSRSHHCCYTGEPFADGEEFYTCIFIDPQSDGYLRRDYAAKNWSLIRKNLDPPPFSFWKSTYEAPQTEEKTEAIEEHSAEATLRRMIDENDSATENARFILALMLERKKTLRPVDEKESDSGTGKLIFYEHKQTGEVFIVTDPQLKLNDIEAVQQEVAALLGGKINQENATPDAEDSPEALATEATSETSVPTVETPTDTADQENPPDPLEEE